MNLLNIFKKKERVITHFVNSNGEATALAMTRKEEARAVNLLTCYKKNLYILIFVAVGWFGVTGGMVLYRDYEIMSNYDAVVERCDSLSAELELARAEERIAHVYTTIGELTVENSKVPVSDSAFLELCERAGALYPDVLLAQAHLESAHFRSEVFRANNNCFGMKHVYRRPTTQTGNITTKADYGHYKNWQMCVIDRILWDVFTFKDNVPTRSEYLDKLDNIYAEDGSYRAKLENFLDSAK